MDAHQLGSQLHSFLLALSLVTPRILGAFIALPMFAREALPGGVRAAMATCLALVAVPPLMPHVGSLTAALGVMLAIKESFLGFALGYAMTIPFWALECAAFFIDNQRGATIGASLDPLTGNDSSELGQLFLQGFIVYVLTSGAMVGLLGALYDSYALWPVLDWMPSFPRWAEGEWLSRLDTLTRSALLISAPVVAAMFLAELGLALVSRFAPQLQVFVLAMPIKSGLAFFVLMMYVSTLFSDAGAALRPHWGESLTFVSRAFGMHGPEAAR